MVPTVNSLPIEFQGPINSLCVKIVRKSTIRGLCYSYPPKFMPTDIVNNNSPSFTICILQIYVIKRGTTTRLVLCGCLSLASNTISNAVFIADGEIPQSGLFPLLFSSNQSDVSIEVKFSLHQYLS